MAYLLCYSYTCSKLERHHYSFLRACEKIALNYAMRRSWPPTPNRKSEIPRSAPQTIKSKIPSFVPPSFRGTNTPACQEMLHRRKFFLQSQITNTEYRIPNPQSKI